MRELDGTYAQAQPVIGCAPTGVTDESDWDGVGYRFER